MLPSLLTKEALATLVDAKLNDNLASLHAGLVSYGVEAGLNQPHRLVAYLAQMAHESMGFVHDKELWGPTAAQKRYEGRKDLGNTQPGDGFKFRGRTASQITGRHNTGVFRDWCRAWVDPKCPDFCANPDLMNTDPWEGLGPIWYWDTRALNRFADLGDNDAITRSINGGYNGQMDRLKRYTDIGLRALGYQTTAGGVRKFQIDRKLVADGVAGAKTRAEIHACLKACPELAFNLVPVKPQLTLWDWIRGLLTPSPTLKGLK
jgi:putative chitinase